MTQDPSTTTRALTPEAVAATAEAYLATWNASGEDRRALLERHWSPEASYVDPMAAVRGHDGLDAVVTAVHEQFPGFVLTPVGEADGHHDQLRLRWGLGPEGAEPLVVGFDVVVLDEDGRIRDVRGFLDVVPAG